MTNAMDIIRKNNGYIIGPFSVRNGKEIWRLGFDKKSEMENALVDLDNSFNEFRLKKSVEINSKDFWKVIDCISQVVDLINAIENLTLTEKLILRSAIKLGYFNDPRGVSLSELAKIFRITKSGASRNIRRAERKVLTYVEKIITAKLKDTEI